jgi:Ca2+-binding EF-hand superfamily protein
MKLWENHQLTAQEMRETQEYFSLLRDLETEIIITNKLNNILEKISAKAMQPLNFPQRIKQKSPLMVRS